MWGLGTGGNLLCMSKQTTTQPSFVSFEFRFYPILKRTEESAGCQFAGKSCTDLPFTPSVSGLLMSHDIIYGAV